MGIVFYSERKMKCKRECDQMKHAVKEEEWKGEWNEIKMKNEHAIKEN